MQTKREPEIDIAQILGADGSSGRRQLRKRWIAALVLAGVLLTAAIIGFSTGKNAPARYKTQEAKRGSLTLTVTATGTLQPTNTVSVGSELSGILKSVEADYNDRVKIGQVLARLDTLKLEAQITQTKASLDSAKAKVLQAQATMTETKAKLAQLQKVRELSKGKVPSQTEMDAAEAAFERAKADAAGAAATVTQTEAALQANETDLSKSVIRSPINGVVLTRSIEPGQTVAASFQAPVLFTLAEDLTKMELHVNIDEADVGKARTGQKAAFSVAAYPNRTFEARITQVRYGSTTTSGVVTYETVLNVNNADLSLRPGMTATAVITVRKVEDAILVPSAALRFSPQIQEKAVPSGSGLVSNILPRPPQFSSRLDKNDASAKNQQRVWTLKNGQPFAIPVSIGATDGQMTEITRGEIEPGMKLLVDLERKVK